MAERVVAVVNAGSSSLKYELLSAQGASYARGNVERIGETNACPDHGSAVEHALADLTARVPGWRDRLAAVGHRIVHGGPNLSSPTRFDDSVLTELDSWVALAPLHLPSALRAVRAARKLLPAVPQVAVFDTGFHHELPAVARTYAIPSELAEKWAIRRYGAHGISCEYLTERLTELDPGRRRLILCHLGAGASLTAVLDGRSFDTSMGFTPLEGLVMATRSGDIDPAVALYLQQQAHLSVADVAHLLENESGLKGLSGTSGDFRAVEERIAAGDGRARLAFDVFAYRVRKYVGAYWAAMGGLDALVFAGGIGENSATLRSAVTEPLIGMGVQIDSSANLDGQPERSISPPGSPISVWVIPTRESLVIARHAFALAA